MPVDRGFHERENRLRYFVILGVASPQLVRDIHGHVPGPTFSGVESDDADRVFVLPVQ